MPDLQLNATLMAVKLNPNDIKDIMGLRSGGHYQLACQKHFEISHPNYSSLDMKMVRNVHISPICNDNQYLLPLLFRAMV